MTRPKVCPTCGSHAEHRDWTPNGQCIDPWHLSPERPRSKGLGLRTYLTGPRTAWYDASMINTTDHAERQARMRGIDPAEVAAIVAERVGESIHESAAVLVGYCEEVARGYSNGDAVWAILRAGIIATVMYRRTGQPATAAALRVERVWA